MPSNQIKTLTIEKRKLEFRFVVMLLETIASCFFKLKLNNSQTVQLDCADPKIAIETSEIH